MSYTEYGEPDRMIPTSKYQRNRGQRKGLHTFWFEVHILELRSAGHQLCVDFMFSASSSDEVTILYVNFLNICDRTSNQASNLGSKVENEDGIELVVYFCHGRRLKQKG